MHARALSGDAGADPRVPLPRERVADPRERVAWHEDVAHVRVYGLRFGA